MAGCVCIYHFVSHQKSPMHPAKVYIEFNWNSYDYEYYYSVPTIRYDTIYGIGTQTPLTTPSTIPTEKTCTPVYSMCLGRQSTTETTTVGNEKKIFCDRRDDNYIPTCVQE